MARVDLHQQQVGSCAPTNSSRTRLMRVNHGMLRLVQAAGWLMATSGSTSIGSVLLLVDGEARRGVAACPPRVRQVPQLVG